MFSKKVKGLSPRALFAEKERQKKFEARKKYVEWEENRAPSGEQGLQVQINRFIR